MKCKAKGCNDEASEGFSYCNKHLCNKTKRDRTRCKNKKFKRKNYCFIHAKYIRGKVNFLNFSLAILAIILAIFFPLRSLYLCPRLHYFCFGSLEIDFKENPEDITYSEGKPYARIEVLNELGHSLQNINGTVTIACTDMADRITSKKFKLPEKREFLPHNQVDFLIAQDQLFIDIINTRNDSCSDANLVKGIYKAINETHAKLIKINSYELFNDKEPIQKEYKINETIESNTCLYCNIITKIYTPKNKNFTKTETHKFVGFHTIIDPLPEVITYSSMTNIFHLSYKGYLRSFKPCEKLSREECEILVCNEVNKYFETGIACTECKSGDGGSLFPFDTTVITPVGNCE